MLSGRSLIKIKNNMGPKTELLGIPDNTGTGSEQTTSKTFSVRPDSQAEINWRISLLMPYSSF